jgi:hypothetical protein
LFDSTASITPQQLYEATANCFDPHHFDSLWQGPIKTAFDQLDTTAAKVAFHASKKDFALYKPDPWWSSFWTLGFIVPDSHLTDPGALASRCADFLLQMPQNILPYHPDVYLSVGFDCAIVICTQENLDSRIAYLKLFQFMVHAWYQLHYLDQLLSSRIPELMDLQLTSISDLDERISEIKNLRRTVQQAFDWADVLTLTIWAEYVDILMAIRRSWLMDQIEGNIRRKIENIDRLYSQTRDDILQKENAAQTRTLLFLSFLSLVSILAVAAEVFGFLDFNPTAPFLSILKRVGIIFATAFVIILVLLLARWKRWIGVAQ